jgi:SAM-dependent methyltransferase
VDEPTHETLRGYSVIVRRFEFAGRAIELLGPGNFEGLIDDERVIERFAKDEFMPYWAEFWPACLLLADLLAAWPRVGVQTDEDAGRDSRGSGCEMGISHQRCTLATPSATGGRCYDVLELGAGLGLVSLIASHLGYRVLCSDYEEDALAFVRESAQRNGIPPPETRYIDWRERYDELRFDRIVAAEVLYEKRNLAPIAEFVAQQLTPGGQAILVDRNRPTADAFPEIAAAAGLSVEVTPLKRAGYGDPKPLEGRAFGLRRLGDMG